MITRHLLLALALASLQYAAAQAPPAGTEASPVDDMVRDAINQFNRSRQPADPSDEHTEPPCPEVAPPATPAPEATTAEPPAPEDPPVVPEPSLTVKVEKLQLGEGPIDPKSVKLRAPFPAKPLAAIPAGWRLESPATAPPFLRTVELAPGASITLTIRPHLLVPDSDGATRFAITEPGLDPSLGYRQTHTVGAVLATSIRQLDADAKQLGDAIDQLQQLVMALPQPEPKPSSKPNSKTSSRP